MCEHFPSPYIGYNWETDMFYCVLCDENFKIEEEKLKVKEKI